MNPEFLTLFRIAIALAKGPCECKYTLDGKTPYCVVGQYMALRGVSMGPLRDNNAPIGMLDLDILNTFSIDEIDLLDKLQRAWDLGPTHWVRTRPDIVEDRRARMLEVVEMAFSYL
jgi:hypothetical protein